MKPKIKALLLFLCFIAVAFASYFHGKQYGFTQGYLSSSFSKSYSESYFDVVVLELLRKGETDRVISAIEGHLDSAIGDHFMRLTTPLPEGPSSLYSIDLETERKFMTRVAEYRRQYSPKKDKDKINFVVEHYSESK